ncbi:HpcH/HpaI aldolase/citrate lyase family protein [Celeribacter arenosi]|uniref:4-hydroxy-2-oxoheptanedioate aldolase n=1 Tax=Celeribacter arenosi TaxID=792649 RepID=A0ABP7JV53_9RHOB
MDLPVNAFKRALIAGQPQIGFWSTVRDPLVTEMLAGLGYDWLLIDCEHTPRDISDVLGSLQAMNGYPTSPVVRVTQNDTAEIKRLLDIGAQSLLVPYVNTVAQAESACAAVTYAPNGVRGMGGSMRANRFGSVEGYIEKARAEICLILQIETVEALENLEAIAGVEGVDALFVGPADLAASLGYPGQIGHPVVRSAVMDAIRRIRACGKPAGFLSLDPSLVDEAVAAGSLFTALDLDHIALRREAMSQLAAFKARH